MKDLIKFAVVGCGHIGKRHIEIIRSRADCLLVAICDNDPKYKNECETQFFSSLESLIQQQLSLDIICIATPNGLHEQHAIMCLEAGYEIIIEKPIALSLKSAKNIIHVAKLKNKRVFNVMQNRFSAPCVWLNNKLTRQKLGNIFIVQVNCFWNRNPQYYLGNTWHGNEELDGGTLYTQFSHFIDTIYWLFGDIDNIEGRCFNFNHQNLTDFEDSGMVQFNFSNGGFGSLNFSTSVWKENLESSMTVIAEKGSVKIGGPYLNEIILCTIKDSTLDELPQGNSDKYTNHRHFYEYVIDIIKNKKDFHKQTKDAINVIAIIEKMYITIRRNKSDLLITYDQQKQTFT